MTNGWLVIILPGLDYFAWCLPTRCLAVKKQNGEPEHRLPGKRLSCRALKDQTQRQLYRTEIGLIDAGGRNGEGWIVSPGRINIGLCLGNVNVAILHIQICVVKCVVELAAELQCEPLREEE